MDETTPLVATPRAAPSLAVSAAASRRLNVLAASVARGLARRLVRARRGRRPARRAAAATTAAAGVEQHVAAVHGGGHPDGDVPEPVEGARVPRVARRRPPVAAARARAVRAAQDHAAGLAEPRARALGADAEGGYVAFNVAYDNGTTSADNQYTSSFLIVTDLYGPRRDHLADDASSAARATTRARRGCTSAGSSCATPTRCCSRATTARARWGRLTCGSGAPTSTSALMGGQTKDCHDIQWSHARERAGRARRGVDAARLGDRAVQRGHGRRDRELRRERAGHQPRAAHRRGPHGHHLGAPDERHPQARHALGRGAVVPRRQRRRVRHLRPRRQQVPEGHDLLERPAQRRVLRPRDQRQGQARRRVRRRSTTSTASAAAAACSSCRSTRTRWRRASCSSTRPASTRPSTATTTSCPRATCSSATGCRTSTWPPSGARATAPRMFDVRVEELVRATHLPAWRADVQGLLCEVGTCADAFASWKIYSASASTRPLVWDAKAVRGVARGAGLTVNELSGRNADAAGGEGRARQQRHARERGASASARRGADARLGHARQHVRDGGYVYVTNKWNPETAA